MAIRENELSRLRLSLQTGETSDGLPIIRNRTFNRVRHSISDAEVLTVATALGQVQEHPVVSIARIDEAKVMPE